MSKIDSIVKDVKLSAQGNLNIGWAKTQMQALEKIKKRFEKEKPFKNILVGMALHVTKETANLVETIVAGGGEVAITGCNPLSTQDDVAAALVGKKNVKCFAWKGESTKEYYRNLNLVVESMHQAATDGKKLATIDDGLDLVTLIHTKHKDLIGSIIGGTEETTTGVIRLRAMATQGKLNYPVVAVNDNKTKHLFDNYYGTGQSTIDGLLRATSILIAGKTIVIAGYGDCGKGVARRARGFDAHVIVTEVDPVLALQAHMDGYSVMPMKKALVVADLVITVTGNKDIVTATDVALMKDGLILANSGHFDIEIDVAGIKKLANKITRVRPFLDELDMGNKKIYLAGEGRLVNLTAAEGHPSEVMDLSFCGQALALEYIVKNANKLNGCIVLPAKIDQEIARTKLVALKISYDRLSADQNRYLNSWEEGT